MNIPRKISDNFAIYLSKIIVIGRNMPKFWQKQICTVFLRHGVYDGIYIDGILSAAFVNTVQHYTVVYNCTLKVGQTQ